MNITELRTWVVGPAPGVNWVFLRINTDGGPWAWRKPHAAAHPNVQAIETVHRMFPLIAALWGRRPDGKDGYALVPMEPGVGVEIDLDALDHFASESSDFPLGDYVAVSTGRI